MYLYYYIYSYICISRNSKEEKKEEDEPETITSYTSHDTSKKSPKPPKLVDLGAAATFGQETLTAPLTTTSNSQQQNLEELFGDFSSAPGDLFSVQPTIGTYSVHIYVRTCTTNPQ